jgi:hypothetical protein
VKILPSVIAFLVISPPAFAEPPKIPVATRSGIVEFMTLEEYREYVKPMGHLPVPSPIFIFGPQGTPLNAGHIVPPAVPSYGVPHPGQSSMTMRNDGGYHRQSCVPPSYQPPSATAGAVYGGKFSARRG